MVLGDRPTDFDDGRFLKGVGSNHRMRNLAGNRDEGNAVQFGIGQRRDQIRRSRTARCHADTDSTRRACYALCRESAPLFMSGQNGAQLVGETGQRLVKRHARPARIGKDGVHAVFNQRLDENIGTAH